MSDTEKLIEKIKTQIKVLKQEIKDKEDILSNLIEELEDTEETEENK